MSWFFFMFIELRREMIACFVDIGGIVDHNYLNFPFKKTLKNL
jgi:hypothetical protein